MKKVLIAMSGGVDSSVAAWLMQNEGYDCVGAMMKLYENAGAGLSKESACCSLKDSEDARAVANRLGIPFYIFNFTDAFHKQVINRFTGAYQNGVTPNPCIDCNRYMKFERFLKRAEEAGCGGIATGHYARIESVNGRYLLKKGADPEKDQSYVLYSMTQEQLSKTKFPLGGLTKAQVREIALEKKFINAKKRESQDICFAPDGDYAGFIEKQTGNKFKTGSFKDAGGNILGEHKGIVRYTIGQRKGLGISSAAPLYVNGIDAGTNTVTVGPAENLFTDNLTARDINLIAAGVLDTEIKVTAKIRYRQQEQPALIRQTGSDTVYVKFENPQRAVTKGQAVVFYDGDIVVGGGTIS